MHARSAADVEDRARARRQVTLDDLTRAHQLELTESFADPARLVDVVLVVIGDLGRHHELVHERSVLKRNPTATDCADVCWHRGRRRLRDRVRDRAADPPRPHARPPSDRRVEQGRLGVPDPRQSHRPGDRVQRRRRARSGADGRTFDRVPERARPQPARLPSRSAHRGRLRRRPVPVRVRRPAHVGRSHRPARCAVDDRGTARVFRRPCDRHRAPVSRPASPRVPAGCRIGSATPTSCSRRSGSPSASSSTGGRRWSSTGPCTQG